MSNRTFAETVAYVRANVPTSGAVPRDGPMWSVPTAAHAIGLELYGYDTGVIRSPTYAVVALLEALTGDVEDPAERVADVRASDDIKDLDDYKQLVESRLNRRYGASEDYFAFSRKSDEGPSSESGETNRLCRFIVASAMVSHGLDVHEVTHDYLVSDCDVNPDDIGNPLATED